MSGQQLLTVNGVDLCAEVFGHSDDPALLLIGGAGMSMDFWETDFCQTLAATGRRVIRYDLRDTGRSVSYPAGLPGYTSADLIDDAIGLLDALDVRTAHIAGISMGGGIAQYIGSLHADRVASLVLLSTSPAGPVDADLPGVSASLQARFVDPPADPVWTDRDAVADYFVDELRAYAGSLPVDENVVRDVVGRVLRRTNNIEASMKNHGMMVSDDASELAPLQLSALQTPALVLHGVDDPLFPIAHGRALAEAIPGARLFPMEGVGHEVPPRSVWDKVIPEILRHTDR